MERDDDEKMHPFFRAHAFDLHRHQPLRGGSNVLPATAAREFADYIGTQAHRTGPPLDQRARYTHPHGAIGSTNRSTSARARDSGPQTTRECSDPVAGSRAYNCRSRPETRRMPAYSATAHAYLRSGSSLSLIHISEPTS